MSISIYTVTRPLLSLKAPIHANGKGNYKTMMKTWLCLPKTVTWNGMGKVVLLTSVDQESIVQ